MLYIRKRESCVSFIHNSKVYFNIYKTLLHVNGDYTRICSFLSTSSRRSQSIRTMRRNSSKIIVIVRMYWEAASHASIPNVQIYVYVECTDNDHEVAGTLKEILILHARVLRCAIFSPMISCQREITCIVWAELKISQCLFSFNACFFFERKREFSTILKYNFIYFALVEIFCMVYDVLWGTNQLGRYSPCTIASVSIKANYDFSQILIFWTRENDLCHYS